MKALLKATAARAKAALRKGTWSWTAPLEEDVGEEAVEEEVLVEVPGLVVLLPEAVLEDEPDAANVRCQKKRN